MLNKITLILMFSLLAGCQTTLNVASQSHKEVIDKWYELASYASSDLSSFGVFASAELGLVKTPQGYQYRLTNFSLSNAEDEFTINLLSPTFEGKYVCNPACALLVEYLETDNTQGYTLLTRFFNDHEYVLYKFYGDLALLNDQLAVLAEQDSGRLVEYLQVLAEEKREFKDLSEFSRYLGAILSVRSYQYFVDNPLEYYKQYSEDDNQQTNMDGINYSASVKAPEESVLWVLADNVEDAGWSIDETLAGKRHEKSQMALSDLNWNKAKKVGLNVEDSVCTYDKNLFGYVRQVKGKKVVVAVLGQAKIVQDNIVSTAPPGYLFSEKKSVHFQPQDYMRAFKNTEVAKCDAG